MGTGQSVANFGTVAFYTSYSQGPFLQHSETETLLLTGASSFYSSFPVLLE
jgi:hypothetical protein